MQLDCLEAMGKLGILRFSGATETHSLPNRSTITIKLRSTSVACRAYELHQQVRSVPQFVLHQRHPAHCGIK